MRIEKINDTDYSGYIFSNSINDDSDFEKFFQKFGKKKKLSGFYKIILRRHFIGCFFKIIFIHEALYKNSFDFKLEFDSTSNVYFKTKDYFLLDKCFEVCYLDGEYYGLVDNEFDGVIEKVEFGEFVLESDIDCCRWVRL